ncbi:MAG: hypothetical protein RL678_1176 [Pseudomonadota bacterium]|jgi:NAD(P)-dependent dehydrogenase (short-subunit alcohol dehydrogenase family)
MNSGLAGKRVVITGASKGIGFACAEQFIDSGCTVHLVSSSGAALNAAFETLSSKAPGRVQKHVFDLGDSEQRARLIAEVGIPDVWVNNAGAIPGGGLDKVSEEVWRSSWELKLFGYMHLTRLLLPAMIEAQQGVIINVIGIAGASPRYDYIYGSVANAALNTFTRAVGAHSAGFGVRVCGINPGPTETERLRKLYRDRAAASLGDSERWPELLSNLPFGRPSTPEQMASIVTFLASDQASYLSGVVIDADGGAMYRG